MKVYKFNFLRLLEFWLAPVLVLAFIAFLIYTDYRYDKSVSVVKLIMYAALCLLFIGPFVWLFFNHLNNRQINKLTFRENEMLLEGDEDTSIVPYNDIIEIVEYSLNQYVFSRLMSSDITKWHIKTNNQEFIISSLLISQKDLKKHTGKNLKFRISYFPSI